MRIKMTIVKHRPCVSLARFTFCWWHHNQLLMTSWPNNCDTIMWIMISKSSDIDFIHSDIHGWSCWKRPKDAFLLVSQTSLHLLMGHYNDVIMGTIMSQITSLTIVYWAVYSGANQRKHQRFTSLAFVRGIHRGPVNSLHKWPVTQKIFPFDDVIM